jgi:hypothetical protein
MSHVITQTSPIIPFELKRNGFQQFDWKLVGYGLLGYVSLIIFIAYFSSLPMADIKVSNLYTPTGASQVKPPTVGIQFPPMPLKPKANSESILNANSGTPGSNSIVQPSGDIGAYDSLPDRIRRVRPSVKNMQNLVLNDAIQSSAGLTTSFQNGMESRSPAASMVNGNLTEKFSQVTGIRRQGSTNMSVDLSHEGETENLGFERGKNGIFGKLKQAASNLDQYGLKTSGPGQIKNESNGLSGQVDIDPTSFSISEQSTMKGRGEGDLLRVVNSNMLVLRLQYQNALKLNPTLEGVIKVRLTIEANGWVSQIDILEDTIKNSRFVQRITSILRTWRFGFVNTGRTTATLTFPFTSP